MLWSVPPYHFSVCWYSQPKMKRGLSGQIHCIYHQLHQSVCKLWKCRFFAGMYGLSTAGFKYQLLDKVYQVIALVLDYCDVWSGNSSRFSMHDQDAWTAATSDISCTYGFCIIWYDHHMFHILASVNDVIGIRCAPMEVDDQFYSCVASSGYSEDLSFLPRPSAMMRISLTFLVVIIICVNWCCCFTVRSLLTVCSISV